MAGGMSGSLHRQANSQHTRNVIIGRPTALPFRHGLAKVALTTEKLQVALLILLPVERGASSETHCVMQMPNRLNAIYLNMHTRATIRTCPAKQLDEFLACSFSPKNLSSSHK